MRRVNEVVEYGERGRTFVDGLEAGFSASIETHAEFNLRNRAASEIGWSSSSSGACGRASCSRDYVALIVDCRNADELLYTRSGEPTNASGADIQF